MGELIFWVLLLWKSLKRTRMGKCNSDNHYIYYYGQKSLRRNGVALTVKKKSLKCSSWVQIQKQQNDLGSFPRKPFNITVIQAYAPTTNLKPKKLTLTGSMKTYKDLLELMPTNMSLLS